MLRMVSFKVSAMKTVPSGATAIPLRIASELSFRSNSAPEAAPPSPSEPAAAWPANRAIVLPVESAAVGLFAAMDAFDAVARAKIRFPLSALAR